MGRALGFVPRPLFRAGTPVLRADHRAEALRARRPSRFRDDPPYATAEAFGCDVVAEEPGSYGDDLVGRARTLDRDLRQLVGDDNTCRHVLGRLGMRFVELRGHERLGFARLGDYCAERLGWSGRQFQEITRVVAALSHLPITEQAFRRGALGWSKARLLASVAGPLDEAKWIAIASSADVRTLATVTASARAAAREQRRLADNGFDAERDDEESVLVRIECSKRARFLWNEARRLAPPMAGRALAQWQVAEMIAAEASSAPGPYQELWQNEPWRNFAAGQPDSADTDGCAAADASSDPSTDRARAGATGAADRNADRREHSRTGAVAERRRVRPRDSNEASDTGPNTDQQRVSDGAPVGDSSRRSECGPHCESEPSPVFPGPNPTESFAGVSRPDDERMESHDFDPVVSPIEQEVERLNELDAFELDAAMRRVRTAMQRRQARLGSTLGLFLDLRLHDQLGYACGSSYIRERLGLADRTARDLVRVAESARGKSPVLALAYERGELSWLRVLALLSVAKPWNVAAWITRSGEVTLRRLNDEVAWALARADRDPRSIAAMPPPVDSDLGLRDGNRRMCAHGAPDGARGAATDNRRMCAQGAFDDDTTARSRDEFWGVIGRFRITFLAPISVSVAFRTVMQGFASPTEPRWLAIERMLEQVVGEWRRQPSHRDPVFERDGYRCTAPGCSAFSNLHDHHIVPRSAGGSNELSNRTTLCAWHHLRAVHGGLASASGQAPDAVDWEFGLARGRKPLMRLRGDRYRRGASS